MKPTSLQPSREPLVLGFRIDTDEGEKLLEYQVISNFGQNGSGNRSKEEGQRTEFRTSLIPQGQCVEHSRCDIHRVDRASEAREGEDCVEEVSCGRNTSLQSKWSQQLLIISSRRLAQKKSSPKGSDFLEVRNLPQQPR